MEYTWTNAIDLNLWYSIGILELHPDQRAECMQDWKKKIILDSLCWYWPIVYVFLGSLINNTLAQCFKADGNFQDQLVEEMVEYAANHANLKDKYSKLETPSKAPFGIVFMVLKCCHFVSCILQ